MKRLRFKLQTWDEGRSLAQRIANDLNLVLDERDETIVVHDPEETKISISFFLDPREFTFVTIKILDPSYEDKVIPYFNK